MAWTDPQDVVDRWAGPRAPDVTDPQLQTFIDDAEDAVGREFPDIDIRIAAGSLTLRRVQIVVSRMVIRHLRNPENVRTVQDSTGPYGSSTTYAGDNPGTLEMTDRDKRDLAPVRSGVRKPFTVALSKAGEDAW